MSQIEQGIDRILARHPEIDQCLSHGLLNRRSLARYLLRQGAAAPDQFDAVVAALRRRSIPEVGPEGPDLFRQIRVTTKDRILIVDFQKEKSLLIEIARVLGQIRYDQSETLKLVVGTKSIKLFADQGNENALRPVLSRFEVRGRYEQLTEISLMFPDAAIETRGVVARLTRELALHEVVVVEMLTASPELLLYVGDAQVETAYEVIRGLQRPAEPPENALAKSRPRGGTRRRW